VTGSFYPGEGRARQSTSFSFQQQSENCICLRPASPSLSALHTQQTRRKLSDAWGNGWVYSARDQLYHDSLGHIASKSPSNLAAGDRLGSYENPIVDPVQRLVWLYSEHRGVFHLRNDHFRVTKCYPGWITQCCEQREEEEQKV
jgi:hypothetical protein